MTSQCIAAMVVVLFFLTGCGGSDKPAEEKAAMQAAPDQIEGMTKEVEDMIDQEMAKIQKKETSTFPCSLFPQEELETLVGNSMTPASYAFEHVNEGREGGDARIYRRESCTWLPQEAEGNKVWLNVSLPKHFDSGQVICYPALDYDPDNYSAPKPVSGIGDQAWWSGVGLEVCSAKALISVTVRLAVDDEAHARNIAWTMAEKVLASQ